MNMARLARAVIPGIAVHATQRGNHRQTVFFGDEDRKIYLGLLHKNARRYGVSILGYCLMTNHTHLVVIPHCDFSLSRALGQTNMEYARWVQVPRDTPGHLWQARFRSCLLSDTHLWAALRYVELNPVRARMVRSAEEWPWSSASSHLRGMAEERFLAMDLWRERWSPEQWRVALAESLQEADWQTRLREATRTGRPFGETAFLEQVGAELGRNFKPMTRGPKGKAAAASMF